MQADPLRTLSLLEHMRDAAQYIRFKTRHESLATYRQSRDLQQIVERNLEIIGEALGRLSKHDPSIASRITDSREIIGLRNILIHAYDDIDPVRIWRIVDGSVPVLLDELETLMDAVMSTLEGQKEA